MKIYGFKYNPQKDDKNRVKQLTKEMLINLKQIELIIEKEINGKTKKKKYYINSIQQLEEVIDIEAS